MISCLESALDPPKSNKMTSMVEWNWPEECGHWGHSYAKRFFSRRLDFYTFRDVTPKLLILFNLEQEIATRHMLLKVTNCNLFGFFISNTNRTKQLEIFPAQNGQGSFPLRTVFTDWVLNPVVIRPVPKSCWISWSENSTGSLMAS